jgi:hypothetical protein
MSEPDLPVIASLIEKYGIERVLLDVAMRCHLKGEHLAVKLQDAQTGKRWIVLADKIVEILPWTTKL